MNCHPTTNRPWKRALCAAVLITFGLHFAGCATIVRGTTEKVVVESDPSGADVKLSNGMRGTTPVTFTVDRDEDLLITVEQSGHKPVSILCEPDMSAGGGLGMAGNALFGGLIGVGVDAATGATLTHYPNPVLVRLEPEYGPVAEKKDIIFSMEMSAGERRSVNVDGKDIELELRRKNTRTDRQGDYTLLLVFVDGSEKLSDRLSNRTYNVYKTPIVLETNATKNDKWQITGRDKFVLADQQYTEKGYYMSKTEFAKKFGD